MKLIQLQQGINFQVLRSFHDWILDIQIPIQTKRNEAKRDEKEEGFQLSKKEILTAKEREGEERRGEGRRNYGNAVRYRSC